MSRQGKEPESQMVLKRPRLEDRLLHSYGSDSKNPGYRLSAGHPRGP